MNRPNITRCARAFLDLGWSFYPTRPRSKNPLTEICPAWSPYREQLPNAFDIKMWFKFEPEANLALITGPLSRLCIVDCDSEAAITALCALCGVETLREFETPIASSRKGNHVYFLRPDAPDVRASKVAIEREFGIEDLELKADLNCCTAPPSIHESGHLYRFEMSPHRYALAPLPAPLAELATRPKIEVVPLPANYRIPDNGSAYGRAALRNACDRLATTVCHRNDALNNAALAMGQLVAVGALDEPTVRAALTACAAATGLPADEIGPTFESGFRAGLKRPKPIPERQPIRPVPRQSRTLAQLQRRAFA